jgi:hypothetical protein
MFGDQQQLAIKGDQGTRARHQTVRLQPFPAQADEFAEARRLPRIGTGTEDPRVADLGGDHGQ